MPLHRPISSNMVDIYIANIAKTEQTYKNNVKIRVICKNIDFGSANLRRKATQLKKLKALKREWESL